MLEANFRAGDHSTTTPWAQGMRYDTPGVMTSAGLVIGEIASKEM